MFGKKEKCKVAEKENTRTGEEALIEKLEKLSDENLTYFLLVAQALIAEENREEHDFSD